MYSGQSKPTSDARRLRDRSHIVNKAQPGWSQLQISPNYCCQTTSSASTCAISAQNALFRAYGAVRTHRCCSKHLPGVWSHD